MVSEVFFPFPGLWLREHKKERVTFRSATRTRRLWGVTIFVLCFRHLRSILVLVIAFAPTVAL